MFAADRGLSGIERNWLAIRSHYALLDEGRLDEAESALRSSVAMHLAAGDAMLIHGPRSALLQIAMLRGDVATATASRP